MTAGPVPAPHPLLVEAAQGDLPSWTVAGAARRAHIRRVMALLERWGEALELPPGERIRWMALGALHDALRDEAPRALREQVPPRFRELPGPMLHGPAAAARLQGEGVRDGPFLRGVAFHTLGHPRLDPAGRALFAADFLEPSRRLEEAWREELVARYPSDPGAVLVEVLRARLAHQLERRWPLRRETLAFWNTLVEE